MSCLVSIVITSFQRPHLLRWNFYSMARQEIPFQFETIVVNDGIYDGTDAVCHQYQTQLNTRYIFSGHRNLGGNIIWRPSVFAYNIGIKHATGRIIVLCCAEMFHLNNTIPLIVEPVLRENNLLGIPSGTDDRDGGFLHHLETTNGYYHPSIADHYHPLNTKLPFLMAVSHHQLMEIGGYDEDFTGIGYEDNDLVDRLLAKGCHHCLTPAKTIHLYHPRYMMDKIEHPAYKYNESLYYSRQGIIVRNLNREWGVL